MAVDQRIRTKESVLVHTYLDEHGLEISAILELEALLFVVIETRLVPF